jgi:hypothetical protein
MLSCEWTSARKHFHVFTTTAVHDCYFKELNNQLHHTVLAIAGHTSASCQAPSKILFVVIFLPGSNVSYMHIRLYHQSILSFLICTCTCPCSSLVAWLSISITISVSVTVTVSVDTLMLVLSYYY